MGMVDTKWVAADSPAGDKPDTASPTSDIRLNNGAHQGRLNAGCATGERGDARCLTASNG
jgi:hypothetical protein